MVFPGDVNLALLMINPQHVLAALDGFEQLNSLGLEVALHRLGEEQRNRNREQRVQVQRVSGGNGLCQSIPGGCESASHRSRVGAT